MITLTEFQLATPPGLRLDANAGSVLHGALIERLDSAAATTLHEPGLRPYSQHLRVTKEAAVWRIGTLTPPAAQQLVAPLLAAPNAAFYLRDKHAHIAITVKRQLVACTYREFVNHFFLSPAPARRFVMKFATPASFKIDNAYQIFPSVFHIYQSLVNRWNACASGFVLDRPRLIDDLTAYTRIIDYRLRLNTFSVESIRIPAFSGEITLSIAGPEQLVRLAAMLLAYGEISGIGVKTALGMGGVTVWAKPKGAVGLASLLPQTLSSPDHFDSGDHQSAIGSPASENR
ncbi:conserved hypothetical protein [Thermosinus carboxydivorans Nor1]|uniref:CRISPR-associated protein Cas6 C-terminal domain-containing protein n=1 Tax=Thermosinus carboxydivorans Nor1 TaxID=401526 RepID=A1HM59_9FIRM|nr:CRISPR system precrRNA processing endoribonuclease RAMP protein Cas6 [Thermosinus carboxydivorans]EAX48908.1 conserved hypothetical protein [Thermosinus carboxydivorans Nor1]